MVSSFVVSMILLFLARTGHPLSTHVGLVITVVATTVAWVATAYLAPATDRETLVAFYRKVRPLGPGWTPIREAAGITVAEAAASNWDNIPLALLGWVAGCTVIWSSLFTVGNLLYGRTAEPAPRATGGVRGERAGVDTSGDEVVEGHQRLRFLGTLASADGCGCARGGALDSVSGSMADSAARDPERRVDRSVGRSPRDGREFS